MALEACPRMRACGGNYPASAALLHDLLKSVQPQYPGTSSSGRKSGVSDEFVS